MANSPDEAGRNFPVIMVNFNDVPFFDGVDVEHEVYSLYYLLNALQCLRNAFIHSKINSYVLSYYREPYTTTAAVNAWK